MEEKQPYAEVLARRRPWSLGTVLAWVIWRNEEYLDRITNYSQWDGYGPHALDAWHQVLGKIHDGELSPVVDGRQESPYQWFDIRNTEAGAEVAFRRTAIFDREQVLRLWPPQSPQSAKDVSKIEQPRPHERSVCLQSLRRWRKENPDASSIQAAEQAATIVADHHMQAVGFVPNVKEHTTAAMSLLRVVYPEGHCKRADVEKIVKGSYAEKRRERGEKRLNRS